MSFEKMPNANENNHDNYIMEMNKIKEALIVSEDKNEIKDLNDKFINLWKNSPTGSEMEVGDIIDEIKEILEDKHSKNQLD